MATQREDSKKEWTSNATGEDIQLGCLQRIADATEKMATNHVKLQSDYDYMRKERDRYKQLYYAEQKRCSTLKGWITRLKKIKTSGTDDWKL